jgi:glycolate oxidase FAD binding subunit
MSTTDTDVRPRLEEWADVREGSAADQVGGVPARFVVAPADQAAVAAVLRTAYEHGLAVVPTGSGTKLSWGAAPERVDVLLDLSRLDRLVEHAAGDLIAVVASGRRLDALQADLASAGQWLAVDPPRGGTIGGLVATATSGPTRLLHGPVRDLVIGTTMVRADGVVARSGGKVVKNVAGYDLGKLVSGSYGTLGVLTEVAVRLHPLPEASRWVSVPVTSSAHAADLVQRVVHSHLVATAVELDRPADGAASLVVRLDGIGPGVAARTDHARALLGDGVQDSDEAPGWWGTEPAGDVLLKVTHEIASLAAVLDAAAGLDVRGSAAVGTLYASAPAASASAALARLRSAAPGFGGAVVVLDAPAELKATLDVWGPVRGLDLMRRVKDQFDPTRVLSPGRFVGGI